MIMGMIYLYLLKKYVNHKSFSDYLIYLYKNIMIMFLRKKELVSKKVIYTSNICPPVMANYPIMIRTSVIEEYWRTKWFWEDDYTYKYIYEIVQNNNDEFRITDDFTVNDKQLIRQKYIDEEYLAKLAIINYKRNENKSLNNTNID